MGGRKRLCAAHMKVPTHTTQARHARLSVSRSECPAFDALAALLRAKTVPSHEHEMVRRRQQSGRKFGQGGNTKPGCLGK
eukprot:2671992-Amphidinium_carterae.1